METLIELATSPVPYLTAVGMFGFLPGFTLRVFLLMYPKGHPRRTELLGELYAQPRLQRMFFVAEQMETALFEGPKARREVRVVRKAAKQTAQEPLSRRLKRVFTRRSKTIELDHGSLAGTAEAFGSAYRLDTNKNTVQYEEIKHSFTTTNFDRLLSDVEPLTSGEGVSALVAIDIADFTDSTTPLRGPGCVEYTITCDPETETSE